jgi:hypothetical protein
MRVGLFFVAGLESRFEDTHARVFELLCDRRRVHDGRILHA